MLWGQTFAFGVRSVGSTLGRESDGGIVSFNNRRRASSLIARARPFSLWMPRRKVRPVGLSHRQDNLA